MKEEESEYKCITGEAARDRGYKSLTKPYEVFDHPKDTVNRRKEKVYEVVMLDNVIADMNRGWIDYVLVRVPMGIEVWRNRFSMAAVSSDFD